MTSSVPVNAFNNIIIIKQIIRNATGFDSFTILYGKYEAYGLCSHAVRARNHM